MFTATLLTFVRNQRKLREEIKDVGVRRGLPGLVQLSKILEVYMCCGFLSCSQFRHPCFAIGYWMREDTSSIQTFYLWLTFPETCEHMRQQEPGAMDTETWSDTLLNWVNNASIPEKDVLKIQLSKHHPTTSHTNAAAALAETHKTPPHTSAAAARAVAPRADVPTRHSSDNYQTPPRNPQQQQQQPPLVAFVDLVVAQWVRDFPDITPEQSNNFLEHLRNDAIDDVTVLLGLEEAHLDQCELYMYIYIYICIYIFICIYEYINVYTYMYM